VSKTGCCHHLGWTRYQFDLNVTASTPVIEPAAHKGGEWKVDLAAVRKWVLPYGLGRLWPWRTTDGALPAPAGGTGAVSDMAEINVVDDGR
jgi:hypothetical protein